MELEINGITADLGGATIAISRKTIDIDNPLQRFIDITNQFDLPYTPVNNDIFKSAIHINSTNDSFDVLYLVKVIDQFVLFNGYGILAEAKKNVGYKFQIVSKSKDLFDKLDTDLNSFEWDSYDLELNTTSRATVSTESNNHPFCWPHVAMHKKKLAANTSLTDLKYSRPSLYLPGVLSLKLAALGYTFTEPAQYAASLNHTDFLFTAYQKTINETVNGGNTLTGLDTNDTEIDVVASGTTINVHSLKTRWRIRGAVAVTGGNNMTLVVSVNEPVGGTTETQNFVIDSDATEIDFITNDFQTDAANYNFTFTITGTGSVEFTDVLLYSLHNESENTSLSTNPFADYRIKALDNMPEMTFKDVFRTLCVMTNSIQIIDDFAKTMTFKSFSGLQKLRALDWSDKFIQETDDISADFESLAKKNWLKYENDLTVPRLLGSDYFLTNNESLKDENDYIVLPFGASNDVIISSTDMVSIDIYEDDTRIIDQTINIRLFRVDSGQSYFDSWTVIKALYEGIFNSLLRVRAVSAEMDLKKLDVLGWDLVRLIYIDYYSSYFILQDIDDFVSGLTTNVKLLQYGR